MQLLLSNCEATTGVSEKSGTPRPYSIFSATVLNPAQSIERPNRKTKSIGLTSSELSVNDEFYSELSAVFNREFSGMPILYDFLTTMDANGKTILIGFAPKPQTAPLFSSKKDS